MNRRSPFESLLVLKELTIDSMFVSRGVETLTVCAILPGVIFAESSLSIDFGLIMVREEKQSLSGLGEQPLRTRYESEQLL